MRDGLVSCSEFIGLNPLEWVWEWTNYSRVRYKSKNLLILYPESLLLFFLLTFTLPLLYTACYAVPAMARVISPALPPPLTLWMLLRRWRTAPSSKAIWTLTFAVEVSAFNTTYAVNVSGPNYNISSNYVDHTHTSSALFSHTRQHDIEYSVGLQSVPQCYGNPLQTTVY